MHTGYNLTLNERALDSCFHKGDELKKHYARTMSKALADLKDGAGRVVAERVNASWFPAVKADVFISHSHRDSHSAICLAGFLFTEFGLRSFLDFTVWGYGEDLLRMLDDEYCLDRAKGTYNYGKRNRSTAHVHMMVSVALSRTIDLCECVFFLNTPASIVSSDYIGGNTTESPWIYTEIAMTGLVRKKTVEEHRRLRKSTTAMDEGLSISYSVDLSHLTKLGRTDLTRWQQNRHGMTGVGTLDILYALK